MQASQERSRDELSYMLVARCGKNQQRLSADIGMNARQRGNGPEDMVSANLRMLSGEAWMQNQSHATAKTDKYSAHNLVSLVAHTGVTRGPNSNLNTFIFDYGPYFHFQIIMCLKLARPASGQVVTVGGVEGKLARS